MRTTTAILAISMSISTASAFADTYVHGYTRKDGTYVQGHTNSTSDNTVTNNYSYQGNTNPYTGTTGTNSYKHDITSPNFSGADSRGKIGHSNFLDNDSDDNGFSR